MESMEAKIQNAYDEVLAFCRTQDVPEYLKSISRDWCQGTWNMYWSLLELAIFSFEGKVALDFGCKYGHLLPMLLIKGAVQAIGIDAEDTYVEAGRTIFPKLYPSTSLLKSERGYIPLQPETVDFVLINEVISHVNPGYLETVYAEVARILKPNGIVLISDGNNIANEPCREELVPFYEIWENGPDGSKTSRDTVTESYYTRRTNIIRSRYPSLESARVEYLAKNTSGLFGQTLLEVIDQYVTTGELILRPYRRGVYPTNPGPPGVVMERGFHPLQVIFALDSYGISSKQIRPAPPMPFTQDGNWLRDIMDFARWRLSGRLSERLNTLVKPEAWRSQTPGFIILGTKN